eukprot:4552413-Prymnesium_polylepis.2
MSTVQVSSFVEGLRSRSTHPCNPERAEEPMALDGCCADGAGSKAGGTDCLLQLDRRVLGAASFSPLLPPAGEAPVTSPSHRLRSALSGSPEMRLVAAVGAASAAAVRAAAAAAAEQGCAASVSFAVRAAGAVGVGA